MKNKEQKLVLVIPDAVGVRNFLYSGLIKRSGQKAMVLHGHPASELKAMSGLPSEDVEWVELKKMPERHWSFGVRQTLTYAHKFCHNTKSMRFNRGRAVDGRWIFRTAIAGAKALGRMASSHAGIKVLESCYFRSAAGLPEVQDYTRLFERARPSLVLCSNQRAPEVVMPVLAAKALGIPTACFVVSWDNLTSKGRIAAPFDHYLVWSDHMKRELQHYYPGVADNRIHIVGSPQFDAYGDSRVLWSREEFFRRIGADPSRRLICYSGGDAGTCPEDQEHVRILLDLIRSGAINGDPQVLLRPSPADNGRRYDAVRQQYPELIYSPPAWRLVDPNDWTKFVPKAEDIALLANTTFHCDINVNLASTMTLDFAIHDKPVVNIAFDVREPDPPRPPLWEHYYTWEHYAPVVKLGAARFARSPEELAAFVNAYLINPELDREGRRALVDLQIGVPAGRSTQAILEAVQSLSRGSKAEARVLAAAST
jgi:hypothetical protein